MRITPTAHSSTQRTQSAITGTYQGRGQHSSPIQQKASRKRVWSASTTVYGHVWAILGAQAQTRSNIFKAGTGFDAQKQFMANIEDAIASPVDIPSSIARYQKTLQYASTPLDYVFAIGLHLAPSDMVLHPGSVQSYNNEIVTAGSEAAIGRNPGINESEQISKTTGDKSFKGKVAALAGTDHKGPPSGRSAAAAVAPVAPQQHASAADRKSSSRAAATGHEDEKTALIATGVGVSLVSLWLGTR